MEDRFVEQDCTIEFAGHSFESGGAYVLDGKDGHTYAACYISPWDTLALRAKLVTWHGEEIGNAILGVTYRSNFGDRRRHVDAVIKGIRMHGTWCSIDNNQFVRLKSYKNS